MLPDNREECFEELDKDLVAVLQLKADIVWFYPCKVLRATQIFTHSIELNLKWFRLPVTQKTWLQNFWMQTLWFESSFNSI